jgi:hypothetical protein
MSLQNPEFNVGAPGGTMIRGSFGFLFVAQVGWVIGATMLDSAVWTLQNSDLRNKTATLHRPF